MVKAAVIILNWNGEKLRNLKDMLPDGVSYFDIKYYIIEKEKECCLKNPL